MSTNADPIQQKLQALQELQAERDRRESEARTDAYQQTIAERGYIPQIILDEPDKAAQEARLLAELGHPAFVVAHVIVDPPKREPEKSWVEQNVARAESQPSVTPTPPIPDPPPAPARGRVYSNAGIPKPIYDQVVRQERRLLDGDDRTDDGDFPLPPMRRGW